MNNLIQSWAILGGLEKRRGAAHAGGGGPVVDTLAAGSLPVGQATYQVQLGNTIYVSPSGSNTSGNGSQANPYATVAKAISVAPSGSIICCRAGTYHESLTTPSSKALTVQAFPLEAVWFDGTSVYSAWTNNGDGTWSTPYTVTLDRTMGQGDLSGYPGASTRMLTDQVWLDTTQLVQVADGATPGAGQFSVNQGTDTLRIGSSPVGKTARVADLRQFLVASGVTHLKGIGVRRYCPDKIEFGSAMAYYGGSSDGSLIENVVWQDSSVDGFSITQTNCVVRNVTVQDVGHTGINGTDCDGSVFELMLVRRVNRALWSGTPSTSGIKVGHTDTVTIRSSYFRDLAQCNAIWLDETVTDFKLYAIDADATGSLAAGRIGIETELSDGGKIGGVQKRGYVVGCKVQGFATNGIRIHDTGWVRVWNNTIIDGGVIALFLRQDDRINPGTSDSRAAGHTAVEVPWKCLHNEVVNNDISPTSGQIQFAAYDVGNVADILGGQMFDRFAGNWFRPVPPGSVIQLGKDYVGNRTTFNTLSALAAADSTVGGPLTSKLGTNYLSATAPSDPTTIADAIPADVAALLGVTTGAKLIGANTAVLPVPVGG